MNQMLLGSAIPFVVIALWYAARRGRASLPLLIGAPLWMGLGALWAVVPDLPRLIGAHDLYHRLAKDPRTDIFFWHYTIDRIETDSSLYHVGLIVMGLLLLAAAWRELSLREGES